MSDSDVSLAQNTTAHICQECEAARLCVRRDLSDDIEAGDREYKAGCGQQNRILGKAVRSAGDDADPFTHYTLSHQRARRYCYQLCAAVMAHKVPAHL
jgi:hypothetical protein